MLLIIEKGTRVEFAKQHIGMLKQIINILKNYNKNIESSYMQYLDANNLYGWAMSQKLPVNDFKWVKEEDLSQFSEEFKI